MYHLESSKFDGTKMQVYNLDSIIHIVDILIRPFGGVHCKDSQGRQIEAQLRHMAASMASELREVFLALQA